MRSRTDVLAFNRGLISPYGIARVDLKRMAWSAETMSNWMPRVLGAMSLRPGLGYIGATVANAAARFLRFVFSTSDKAMIELTNTFMRVWVDEALVTRGSVSTTITNGGFDANLVGWTDADESGATSDWVAGGYMGLTGTSVNAAIRYQLVSVAVAASVLPPDRLSTRIQQSAPVMYAAPVGFTSGLTRSI